MAIREIVGVFGDPVSLDRAVDALQNNGFNRAAISLLPGANEVARKLGHRYQQVLEIADDPRVPRATFFSPISRYEAMFLPAPTLAMMGALLMIGTEAGRKAALTLGSAGALIGLLIGVLFYALRAARVRDQLARGGLLLWVRVRDARDEEAALEILRAHAAHDIHAHEIPA